MIRRGREETIRRTTFRVCENTLRMVRENLSGSGDDSIARDCLRGDAEGHRRGTKIKGRSPVVRVAIVKKPTGSSGEPPDFVVLHKKRGQRSR